MLNTYPQIDHCQTSFTSLRDDNLVQRFRTEGYGDIKIPLEVKLHWLQKKCIKLAIYRKDYGHIKPIIDRRKYENVYTVLTLKCLVVCWKKIILEAKIMSYTWFLETLGRCTDSIMQPKNKLHKIGTTTTTTVKFFFFSSKTGGFRCSPKSVQNRYKTVAL